MGNYKSKYNHLPILLILFVLLILPACKKENQESSSPKIAFGIAKPCEYARVYVMNVDGSNIANIFNPNYDHVPFLDWN